MKRLTGEQKIKKAKFAALRFKKRLRRIATLSKRAGRLGALRFWDKSKRIVAPEVFSLTRNYDDTIECLYDLKHNGTRPPDALDRRGMFIDLATIKDLQPAAAVVLAAELDRWRRVRGVRLRPQNLKSWDNSVFKFLFDLGLFDLLETDRRYLRRAQRDEKSGAPSRVALRFVSDCRNDREPIERLSRELAQKVPKFAAQLSKETNMAISTALAEASLNSVTHAYEYEETEFPIVDHRWWAAASYDHDHGAVKFFVYDQGVGIPRTLPKTSVGKQLLNSFGARFQGAPNQKSDSEMLVYLLENPISATGRRNRGKGFPQIVAALSRQGGDLRVLSGRGGATYSAAQGAQPLPMRNRHLGGTLLEWTFRLDTM